MSFRGKIAVPIENQVNSLLCEHHRISADIVECGGFISSMNFILSLEIGMTDEVKDLQKKYKDYSGLTYNELSLPLAEAIYREFLTLLNNKD